MTVREVYFPNAAGNRGKTYYVAQKHKKASDSNPGTKRMPFLTISQAAATVDMGDTVIIDAGLYREEIPIKRHGHPYVPGTIITFKAAKGKHVWIKGSDVFDGRWEKVENNVFKARLPEYLFEKGTYNPYGLSCVIDEKTAVRPCEGDELPETLGQIYINGQAMEQVRSMRAVIQKPGSFVVSADGRAVVVHCADGRPPEGQLVELTVREQCFKTMFAVAPHVFGAGAMYIQTEGIVVEHAAEPDPFCRCRPLSIRHNGQTGIIVRKTFHLPSNTDRQCTLMGCFGPSYTDVKGSKMVVNVMDDTRAGTPEQLSHVEAQSDDGGKTWSTVPGTRQKAFDVSGVGYFLDEEQNILIKQFRKNFGLTLSGDFGPCRFENMVQYSRDGGRTWGEAEKIDAGTKTYYRMLKLRSGLILWLFTENHGTAGYHAYMGTRIGKWRADLSGIDWAHGGKLEVDPRASFCGLDEPSACQLDDGRIFVILRQGAVLAAQDHGGAPSVKLYAVSEDDGRSWSAPKPLTYDDGSYVYSPRAMGEVARTPKNGRVYVILNIAGGPTQNCDPRTNLSIAELDQKALCIRRESVAVIEKTLEGHSSWVRFSNWAMMTDRAAGNFILFMKLNMCEYCLVRNGYDQNSYRYEIELP